MTINFQKTACVFGGTGFIGRQIVRALANEGYQIKVATRVPERAFFLRTGGDVGQIVPVLCDYRDDLSLAAAISGCDLVVNCVGILFERGKNTFAAVHTELPRRIAKACAAAKTPRLIHLSALACESANSKYGKSKWNGEMALFENFKNATILRPSVVFGAEDEFFNLFACLGSFSPMLPLIGGGHTKFQPVYVNDIAKAVIVAAERTDAVSQTYELGGPEIFTFRQIYEKITATTGHKPMLVSIPFGLAKVKGFFLQMMPRPLLTPDQVESLKTDNIVHNNAKTFADLGIVPTGVDIILPTYLARYRSGGRFGDKKRA